MATYSTYDYGTKLYTYWDDGKPQPTHTTGSPKVLAMGGIGATVERSAWKVPADAKKVGVGELPKGKVASLGDFASSDIPTLGLLVIGGFLAWRYLK